MVAGVGIKSAGRNRLGLLVPLREDYSGRVCSQGTRLRKEKAGNPKALQQGTTHSSFSHTLYFARDG